jgi:site-specific DNA recombinase
MRSMKEKRRLKGQVFHRLIEQRMSLGEIARRLTQARIPTRNDGGHWERSVVGVMLKNPAYIRHYRG